MLSVLPLASGGCGDARRSPWLRGQPLARRPLNIAHRGFSAIAPENTLEAAQRAFEAGADMWELDTHLSRDGHVVVIHDDDLRRTTDVATRFADDARGETGYRVRDFDLAELQSLDAGSWFVRRRDPASAQPFDDDGRWFAGGNVRIPTLREALDFTRRRNWTVNVEIKNMPVFYEGIEHKVVDLIRELKMTDDVLISSFDHQVIARIKALAPEIAAAPLCGQRLGHPGRYIADILDADANHVSSTAIGAASARYLDAPGPTALFTEDVTNARAVGVRTHVWTVNDFSPDGLAEHLLAIGVGGIITDHPDRLESLLDARFGVDGEATTTTKMMPFAAVPELAD